MLMSNGEIVTEYRQAKDPGKQIGILADMNKTTKRAIVDILRANGCSVPGNYGPKKIETPEAAMQQPETPEEPDLKKMLAEAERSHQRCAADRFAIEDVLALVFDAVDDYTEAEPETPRNTDAFVGYLLAVRDTYKALRGPIVR